MPFGAVDLLVFVPGVVAPLVGFTGANGLTDPNWADNVLRLLPGVVLAGVGFGPGGR